MGVRSTPESIPLRISAELSALSLVRACRIGESFSNVLFLSLGDCTGDLLWRFGDFLLPGEGNKRRAGDGELHCSGEGDLCLEGVGNLLRLGIGDLRSLGDGDLRRGVDGDLRYRRLTGDGDLRRTV